MLDSGENYEFFYIVLVLHFKVVFIIPSLKIPKFQIFFTTCK
jgi:hypothetical protein